MYSGLACLPLPSIYCTSFAFLFVPASDTFAVFVARMRIYCFLFLSSFVQAYNVHNHHHMFFGYCCFVCVSLLERIYLSAVALLSLFSTVSVVAILINILLKLAVALFVALQNFFALFLSKFVFYLGYTFVQIIIFNAAIFYV